MYSLVLPFKEYYFLGKITRGKEGNFYGPFRSEHVFYNIKPSQYPEKLQQELEDIVEALSLQDNAFYH